MKRTYFRLCLALGRLLRSARYSTAEPAAADLVLKRRRPYAALLIWLSRPVTWMLNTRVRILSRREWEERERMLYRRLYSASITTSPGGALLLPRLPGRTLASVLDGLDSSDRERERAIELAVVALARLHQAGETHGDAMAENVLVDLDAGVARWFDFETVHEPATLVTWRRADDLRALVATCVIRTPATERVRLASRMLAAYGDAGVAKAALEPLTEVWRRSLAFHLAQAPMSAQEFDDLSVSLLRPPGL